MIQKLSMNQLTEERRFEQSHIPIWIHMSGTCWKINDTYKTREAKVNSNSIWTGGGQEMNFVVIYSLLTPKKFNCLLTKMLFQMNVTVFKLDICHTERFGMFIASKWSCVFQKNIYFKFMFIMTFDLKIRDVPRSCIGGIITRPIQNKHLAKLFCIGRVAICIAYAVFSISSPITKKSFNNYMHWLRNPCEMASLIYFYRCILFPSERW